MLKPAKHLLIGSTEAHSGKSTISIALGMRLQALGFQVAWGKPLASAENIVSVPDDDTDTDLDFIPSMLSLLPEQQLPTLFSLGRQTLAEQLGNGTPTVLQPPWSITGTKRQATSCYWKDPLPWKKAGYSGFPCLKLPMR